MRAHIDALSFLVWCNMFDWNTWKHDWQDKYFFLPNYSAFHLVRSNKQGGRVSVYMIKKLNAIELRDLPCDLDHLEAVSVSIKLRNKNFNVFSCYVAPTNLIMKVLLIVFVIKFQCFEILVQIWYSVEILIWISSR